MGKQVDLLKEKLKKHVDFINEYNSKEKHERDEKSKYSYTLDMIARCCRRIVNETLVNFNYDQKEELINKTFTNNSELASRKLGWYTDISINDEEAKEYINETTKTIKDPVERVEKIETYLKDNLENEFQNIKEKVYSKILENHYNINNNKNLDVLEALENFDVSFDTINNINFDDYLINYEDYTYVKETKKYDKELDELIKNETDNKKIEKYNRLKEIFSYANGDSIGFHAANTEYVGKDAVTANTIKAKEYYKNVFSKNDDNKDIINCIDEKTLLINDNADKTILENFYNSDKFTKLECDIKDVSKFIIDNIKEISKINKNDKVQTECITKSREELDKLFKENKVDTLEFDEELNKYESYIKTYNKVYDNLKKMNKNCDVDFYENSSLARNKEIPYEIRKKDALCTFLKVNLEAKMFADKYNYSFEELVKDPYKGIETIAKNLLNENLLYKATRTYDVVDLLDIYTEKNKNKNLEILMHADDIYKAATILTHFASAYAHYTTDENIKIETSLKSAWMFSKLSPQSKETMSPSIKFEENTEYNKNLINMLIFAEKEERNLASLEKNSIVNLSTGKMTVEFNRNNVLNSNSFNRFNSIDRIIELNNSNYSNFKCVNEALKENVNLLKGKNYSFSEAENKAFNKILSGKIVPEKVVNIIKSQHELENIQNKEGNSNELYSKYKELEDKYEKTHWFFKWFGPGTKMLKNSLDHMNQKFDELSNNEFSRGYNEYKESLKNRDVLEELISEKPVRDQSKNFLENISKDTEISTNKEKQTEKVIESVNKNKEIDINKE